MRILVISNLYPPDVLGGYEMGCKQAVDALRQAGHEVFVLVGQPRGMAVPYDAGVQRRLKMVDIYDQYFDWKAKPLVKRVRHHEACNLQSANVHVLTDVVQEFKPDVAYLWNLIGLGGLGLMAALQHMGVPWVMHLMDDVPRSLCAVDREAKAMKPVADALTKLARGRYISCSQTTVAEVVAAGIDITARTTVVPNWVTATGSRTRTEYMRGGKLRILQAGAISTAKGVDLTIRAADELRYMGYTNFEIDLYGPGTDPAFQNLITSMNLNEFVRIKGMRTQKELYDLYPQYDVFAFPTWAREPFGFAPMEAMAFGCVAVLSRACGVSEWFVDGLDCLKTERDPHAMAVAWCKLIRGEASLQEIGQQAARLVHREYRMGKILPRIEAILADAIREGGGPARPPAEAFHVALLAEKTFQCLMNESAA